MCGWRYSVNGAAVAVLTAAAAAAGACGAGGGFESRARKSVEAHVVRSFVGSSVCVWVYLCVYVEPAVTDFVVVRPSTHFSQNARVFPHSRAAVWVSLCVQRCCVVALLLLQYCRCADIKLDIVFIILRSVF